MCLRYQQTHPQEKIIPYELLCKLWEVVGADIFVIKNKMLLCIAHYYNKFPIVKKVGSLVTDSLVQTAKMIFAEFGLPK